MPRDFQLRLEVVLRRVFSNNTDTAHLAGRALPSIPPTTALNARMDRTFSTQPSILKAAIEASGSAY
jgi:hypothetical protein